MAALLQLDVAAQKAELYAESLLGEFPINDFFEAAEAARRSGKK